MKKRSQRIEKKMLPNLRRGLLFKTVQPLPHEGIASWLHRLGKLHGVPPFEILKQVLDYDKTPTDLELELTEEEVGHLMYFVRGDKAAFQLNEALFKPLRKKSHYPLRERSAYQWIVEHGVSSKPHYGFCPACLKEDEIPYWRVEWRFRHWMVCPSHRCWMQTLCPHCGHQPNLEAPYLVKGRRLTVMPSSLGQCAKCAKDLYEIDAEQPGSCEAEFYIGRQKALLSTLINGYCIVRPFKGKQSILTAMRLLRLTLLHPVDVDFGPNDKSENANVCSRINE